METWFWHFSLSSHIKELLLCCIPCIIADLLALSFLLDIYLFVWLSIYLSVGLIANTFVCRFDGQYVCLLVCFSMYLSVCLLVWLSVCPSLCFRIYQWLCFYRQLVLVILISVLATLTSLFQIMGFLSSYWRQSFNPALFHVITRWYPVQNTAN